ncbi:MAG TPA: putative lipid II flippase FtsW [Bacillota bacterium]
MYTRRSADLHLVAVVVLLLGIGVLMVFSSSFVRAQQSLGDPYYYFKRQSLWLVVGVTAMVLVSQVQYWHWRVLARPLLMLTFLTLVLVIIPGVGQLEGGARRWLGVGPLSFQPSELAKLTLVIFLASHFARLQGRMGRAGPVYLPFLGVVGATGLLIMLQPDLGTAVAITATAMVMLFVAGAPILQIAGLVLAAVPLGVYLVFSEEYRARRILAFLNPEADPLGSGFHILQSLYALGSGGLFGVGFFEGRQKFYYLPAQHTDFIFAVLGEELGFLGTVAVVLLFAMVAWRGYRIAATAPDAFASMLAAGLTTLIVLQAIINIGVVTASLPITGISLPFVSYGGSSLVVSLTAVGILVNISKHAQG